MDHYKVLGVPRDTSQESIKRAYIAKAIKLHPDKAFTNTNRDPISNDSAALDDEFFRVQRAWEVLRDPVAKTVYDDELREKEARSTLGVVNEEVDLDAMEYDEDSSMFTHPCRCGSHYSITEEMLERGEDSVQCGGCSLRIKVAYEQVEVD
ncbi:Diphthamide biosynthesis protein 4 [Gonapodya sp. JEL0774]|nr:Diphthamide biosynthesis protein 4 [Gonapodya sp. JEL0774]